MQLEENHMKDTLIESALEQIISDVNQGDVTAIHELLKSVDVEVLEAFLPEYDDPHYPHPG